MRLVGKFIQAAFLAVGLEFTNLSPAFYRLKLSQGSALQVQAAIGFEQDDLTGGRGLPQVIRDFAYIFEIKYSAAVHIILRRIVTVRMITDKDYLVGAFARLTVGPAIRGPASSGRIGQLTKHYSSLGCPSRPGNLERLMEGVLRRLVCVHDEMALTGQLQHVATPGHRLEAGYPFDNCFWRHAKLVSHCNRSRYRQPEMFPDQPGLELKFQVCTANSKGQPIRKGR
ncbi:MAG: hypothetical protein AAGA00_03335 [Pseudomonadota bacterium]